MKASDTFDSIVSVFGVLVVCICTAFTIACGAPEPPPRQSSATTAASAEVQTSSSGEPEQCAQVGFVLDLRALPQPVSAAEIRLYTLGQAQDFRELVPAGLRVEIFYQEGVAAFAAKLYSTAEDDLVATCESLAAGFVETVPGHPLAHRSGGSIVSPCAECPPPEPPVPTAGAPGQHTGRAVVRVASTSRGSYP